LTDIQILTLALAVIVPLSLLLLSNSRISDTRVALDGKINDTRVALDGKISDTRDVLDAKISDTRDVLDGKISDTRVVLERRIDDMRDVLRAEMKTQHTEVMARLAALEAFLRDAVMSKLDDHERRLTDLEGQQG